MAKAPINGSTLLWAREVAHVTVADLARAAGTTPARIAEFEQGDSHPTFRQLGLLAAKLDRPLGFFFAPAPAAPDVPNAPDFRGLEGDELPSALVREMKRAEQHREVMLDLGDPPERTTVGAVTWETAQVCAKQLRTAFGLTDAFTPPESQANQVFNFWRGLVEAHGYLVFQTTRIPLETFRGLSIDHEILPVILINGADASNGKVFTLFHELAHLANRTSGLCALEERVDEEAVANHFAACCLLPEAAVRRIAQTSATPLLAAAGIASALKVSTLAAGVRLRRLGLINEADLATIRQRSQETWEQARASQRESDGFVPPWRLRYRDLGSNYIGTVARALADNRIDALDATYLMNARLPMVEQLLAEYYRTGGDT